MVCFASGVLLSKVAREVFYGDFVEVKLPESQFFNSERVRMLSMNRICFRISVFPRALVKPCGASDRLLGSGC